MRVVIKVYYINYKYWEQYIKLDSIIISGEALPQILQKKKKTENDIK